ncbi:unnamed protein product, partial [Rotaria magnacalcarata]
MLSRRTLDANPHRTRNGWIQLATIIFIMIVLLFVAICIVLSLLPTYLPDKTITGITTNGRSTFLSVRYLTYADLTGKTVANTVNVGQQVSTTSVSTITTHTTITTDKTTTTGTPATTAETTTTSTTVNATTPTDTTAIATTATTTTVTTAGTTATGTTDTTAGTTATGATVTTAGTTDTTA